MQMEESSSWAGLSFSKSSPSSSSFSPSGSGSVRFGLTNHLHNDHEMAPSPLNSSGEGRSFSNDQDKEQVKELPHFPLFSSSIKPAEDQPSAFSSFLFADTPIRGNDNTEALLKLTNHAEELKLELDMWRKAYRELQAKHTARLESIFKEQKQREDELREKYEEEKALSLKCVSKASYVILTDLKNLMYMLRHQNIETIYEMINSDLIEKDLETDQFVTTYKEFKNVLYGVFKALSHERQASKDNLMVLNNLKKENERLEATLHDHQREKALTIDSLVDSDDDSAAQERIAMLEEKTKTLENIIKDLEDKSEKIKADKIELEKQVLAETRVRKNIESNVETMTKLKIDAESQVNYLRDQLQQREQIIKTKQMEIDRVSESLSIANDKLQNLETSLEKLKEKYGEENSYDYSELQQELDEVTKRLNHKNQENEDLIRSYEMRIAQMQMVIQESQKVIDLESKKTESITAHHTELIEAVDRLKVLLLDSGVIIKNSRDHQSIVDKAVEFISVRNHHLSNITRDFDLIKKRLEETENDKIIIKKELENVIENLQRKLSEDARAREEERLKFDSIVHTLEEQLQQKRDASNEQAQMAAEQTKRLTRTVERLQIDLGEKDKQLQSANNQIRSLREENEFGLSARDERIRQLEETISKKEDDLAKMTVDLNKEVDHLKKKIKRLQGDNEALQIRVDTERANLAKEAQAATLQLEEAYAARLHDCEMKMDSMGSQLSSYAHQIKEQDDRILLLLKEKEELMKRDPNGSFEKLLEEQIKQLQEHYESEKEKYRLQYEHMVKKYKNLKEKYFKQSLRQNELQNYLLKLKKKHKKKKEEGVEEQDEAAIVTTSIDQTHSKFTANTSPMNNQIFGNNPYSSSPVIQTDVPSRHQQYYDAHHVSSQFEDSGYPKFIYQPPPPQQHHSPSINENTPPTSFYQPISSVSITKKSPPNGSVSNHPSQPSSLSHSTTTSQHTAPKKKKKSTQATTTTNTSSHHTTSRRPSSNPHTRR
ncbi:hypothetical protein C9374_008720 [Naegleria lovaniensis]|uniref:Uncharacterized protein n=1 Tax=Naegleria lovaniensis TaxID=51637 RepID=A0AA88GL12_NAELO|nr:uncharacterized protein C9374_008720 [Naegleria lovaniensis]KAG2378098.1 hypothetical protein C9374_008720 [Naegleria lovaniensis]